MLCFRFLKQKILTAPIKQDIQKVIVQKQTSQAANHMPAWEVFEPLPKILYYAMRA